MGNHPEDGEGPEIRVYDKVPAIKEAIEILKRRGWTLSQPGSFSPRSAGQRVSKEGAGDCARRVIPPEAGIAGITFDETRGEVTVTAARPGLAIGLLGVNIRAIQGTTGWKVVILRVPATDPSK